MRRATRFSVLALPLVVFALAVTGCKGKQEAGDGGGAEIRIPIVDNENSPKYLAFERFGEELDSLLPGHFKVEVFPAAQLGGESDYLRSMGSGVYELTSVSAGVLADFAPQLSVLDIPFVFRDAQEARTLIDGPVGTALLASVQGNNIVALAFWEQGFRSITTSSRTIPDAAALRGLKIRTMNAANHVAAFEAMGANPTPMDWGGVYTALQTGAIDAQENPPSAILSEGLYSVQEHLYLTRHLYDVMPVVARADWWNQLSPEERTAVNEALGRATAFERDLTMRREAVAVDSLAKLGMETDTVPSAMRDTLAAAAQPAVVSRIQQTLGSLGPAARAAVGDWLGTLGLAGGN